MVGAINDQTVDAAGARQTLRAQDRPENRPAVSRPVLVGSPREAPSGLRDAALLPAQRSELPGAAGAPPLHARAPDRSESSLVHAARPSPAIRGRQLASPDAALEGRDGKPRHACSGTPSAAHLNTSPDQVPTKVAEVVNDGPLVTLIPLPRDPAPARRYLHLGQPARERGKSRAAARSRTY